MMCKLLGYISCEDKETLESKGQPSFSLKVKSEGPFLILAAVTIIVFYNNW